jgi:DNA-binding CsgD family transcriptional regulator
MPDLNDAAVRLIGRTAELDALLSALAAVEVGSAGLVRLRGVPGSGKTTVLDVFSQVVGGRVQILRGTCASPGDGGPRQAMDELFPGPAPGGETPLPLRSHQLYQRLVDLSIAGPVVLVLDDFHWCDDESLDLLAHLLHRGTRLPLLVVVALRPARLPSWHRLLAHSGAVTTIDLRPFGEPETARLALEMWSVPPGPGFVAAVTAQTGGNPALLSTLFARLVAEGAGPDDAGAVRARELGPASHVRLLERTLTDQQRYVGEVAEAVALLGRVDPELVSMLSGVSERLVDDAILVLRRHQILGADGAEFAQPYGRATVLSRIPDRKLESWRLRAARLLNYRGCPAEEIGAHLVGLPGLPEQWMREVLTEAARTAERAGRLEEARRYLGPLVADDPADLAARIDFARVVGLRDPLAAYAALAGALGMSRDARTHARVSLQLAKAALMVREVPEAVQVLTGALDRLNAELDTPLSRVDRDLRTQLEAALLAAAFDQRPVVQVIGALLREISVPDGHTPAERQVLAMTAVARMLEGTKRDVAVALARQALDGVEAGADWVCSVAAYVLYLADEADEAIRAVDELAPKPLRDGAGRLDVMALTIRSWVTGGAGDLADALSYATAAVRLAERESWRENASLSLVSQAMILAQQGDFAGAAQAMARIDPASLDTAIHRFPHYLMARSKMRRIEGDVEGSLADLLRCGQRLDEAGARNPVFVPWWLDAVRILGRLDRRDEAHELVELGEELALAWGTASGRGLALLGRGVAAEGRAAIDGLADAVDVLSGTPAVWYRTDGEILLGEALLKAGDRLGARKHYRLAVDLSVRAGFWGQADRARAGVTEAGGRNYQVTGNVTDVLTLGERRVGDLAAAGATNREIADTLLITLRTVEIHLTSVYRKLGVSGKPELQGSFPRGLPTTDSR